MRNGSIVWWCQRTSKDGDDIEEFAEPIELRLRVQFLTIQPTSGYDSVKEFGENVENTWNCIGQPYDYWFGKVKVGDRWYVDGAEPYIPTDGSVPEDGWGADANARVKSVRPQNYGVRFILEKIE